MSGDLAEVVAGASPEVRANLRAALDAADRDPNQLSRDDLKGMTSQQIMEAHAAGRLNQITGREVVDAARAVRKERRS